MVQLSIICFSAIIDVPSAKELLISIFLLITAPISGYMLIKPRYHRLKAHKGTKGVDNIED